MIGRHWKYFLLYCIGVSSTLIFPTFWENKNIESIEANGEKKNSVVSVVAIQQGNQECSQFNVDAVDSMEIVLIKIGGSSITDKAQKETLNHVALDWFVTSLTTSISSFFQEFDYESDEVALECFDPNIERKKQRAYVIVHGAGSFGHHTAKEYQLSGKMQPSSNVSYVSEFKRRHTMKGLSATREYVQKLNAAIISSMLKHGINAVGISPCFGVHSIEANGFNDEASSKQFLSSVVYKTLSAGLVPVLHGDACLYGRQGAGILSGDTIMEIIGKAPWVSEVVFISDVDGVFTADPNFDPDAILVKSIKVKAETGEIDDFSFDATSSSHQHDVTGGFKVSISKTRNRMFIKNGVSCMSNVSCTSTY